MVASAFLAMAPTFGRHLQMERLLRGAVICPTSAMGCTHPITTVTSVFRSAASMISMCGDEAGSKKSDSVMESCRLELSSKSLVMPY